MLLWIKLDSKRHLRFQNQTSNENVNNVLVEIETNLLPLALENDVQVTEGSLFHCNKSPGGKLHFRMAFAAALEEDLGEGVEILRVH
ncbi:L-kynurenine/alpha-aminoadipate aminotransferase [Penicillium argentinense]|uniref:L-kynurenine/alpha-aminoadipate aminotransferase n=1 Tax=Penicillium argentinense TaxID=1131581 RepID=A0A9W9ENS3_9EURO|nr:L-kynurenine/alpha-aminoadipate aminotransferase [Penicillium argentinense]KAJ5085191.1 L-kynurenine/alpha-aminoadipate aminotransferase [Penicillium argentinense]